MINIHPQLLTNQWAADWITFPYAEQKDYGVYHFRKTFFLELQPEHFIIHVTADNRYRLYINGEPALSGPARGDLQHWYYESIDIAPYLSEGYNTIAALVWNMGDLAPLAQLTNQTGFLLQSDTEEQQIVNTDESWRAWKSTAYNPCSTHNMERLRAYMVVGPGDEMDGRYYDWDWEKPEFNDKEWLNAKPFSIATPISMAGNALWILVPREIPLLQERLVRFYELRRTDGLYADNAFLKGQSALTIPPNTEVSLLIDQQYLIVAYPELIISGGSGSSLRLTYAEGLFDEGGLKGNRNEVEDRHIFGNYDVFIADGGMNRLFRPLWFRAYRYVQVDIITKEEALLIDDFYSLKTGYPLESKASFSCNDLVLKDIWNAGWRTAQNCAGDIYYDTPYYEQLQYVGDSRIQALISLYVAGDDRLMRKCITDFFHSRIPEGLTQSRYPCRKLQVIPAFSLFWVSMIHDYWMLRKDDDFIKPFLPAIIEIMNWFQNRIDTRKKMLGALEWWNFVDWDNFDARGTAPGTENGCSSIVSLQYSYTLNQAAEIFEAFNVPAFADLYKSLAKEIGDNTYFQCFNEERGLMADTPTQLTYSQHAGIWTVLSDTVTPLDAKRILTNILNDKSIGQATYFYRFYLTQALKKANMADLYYSMLKPWKDMLDMGLTTFAEKPEPTRSDCHAWSASPNYDFLATICGLMPSSPGFATILIQPALGELLEVKGRMPHPLGELSVSFKKFASEGLQAEINLPLQLTGSLIWKDKSYKLQGGMQYFTL